MRSCHMLPPATPGNKAIETPHPRVESDCQMFPTFPFSQCPSQGWQVCSGEPRFKRESHPHCPWPSGQRGHFLLTRARFAVTHAGIHLLTKTAPPSLLINRKPEDVELEKRIKFQGLRLFQRKWKDSSDCAERERRRIKSHDTELK